MKKIDSDLVEDVEELLEKSVLEEATALVWKTFEEAMDKLDPESRSLLEEYFEGTTIETISKKKKLPSKELKKWVDEVKRQVSQNLRKNITVRQ